MLGVGYISKRNDNITELRIQGFDTVYRILTDLQPFIRFKAIKARSILEACALLRTKKKLSTKDLHAIVVEMLIIQKENYQSPRKKTEAEIF